MLQVNAESPLNLKKGMILIARGRKVNLKIIPNGKSLQKRCEETHEGTLTWTRER